MKIRQACFNYNRTLKHFGVFVLIRLIHACFALNDILYLYIRQKSFMEVLVAPKRVKLL